MFDNPELFKKFGKTYEAGKVIFCEYEIGNELYFILSGKVKISKISRDKDKAVAYLGPGEFVGEMAIFENKPRTATVTTEEETKVLALKKDDFFKLMSVAPNLVVDLIKTLSIRYINTEKQLNTLLMEDIDKRIINYFYEKSISVSPTVKSLEIKISEAESILDIPREELVERLITHKRKGYLKITAETITLVELGWWCGLKK